MLGDHGHRWNQLQRIVHRHLGRLTDCCIAVAVVDIVNAQYVGNKQPVKLAAFKDFRQVSPVLQVFVLP